MQKCDSLVHAKILLTQDDKRTILNDHSLAIRDGKILDIAPKKTILAAYDPRDEIGAGLVLPGLINAHAHAAMTFARGLGDDLPLMEWLETRIFPLEARLVPKIVRLGSLLGHAEMLARGVTACMDMYIFEDEVFNAAEIAGIRLVGGEAVFGFPSAACKDYHEALDATRKLRERCKGNSRLACALNPHSVYTTNKEILTACRDLAQELNLPLHIHLAETDEEVRICEEKTGLRPIAYCDSLGLFDVPTTLAHGVRLNAREIDLLAQKKARIAHNPSSNMKLASGIAPVTQMLAKGLAVGLGTDGPASNNQINIIAEMNRAALLHKVANNEPTALCAQKALDMATIHGGACLHQPDLGRLVIGGPADLAGFDLSSPNMLPMHNPVSQIVYAATGHECALTMVEGEALYRDGRFTRFDYEALLGEIDELMDFVRN